MQFSTALAHWLAAGWGVQTWCMTSFRCVPSICGQKLSGIWQAKASCFAFNCPWSDHGSSFATQDKFDVLAKSGL
ncbi:hypothetical protein J3E68DRAFT_412712 [Trichoderma sp. SZMC 28012]